MEKINLKTSILIKNLSKLQKTIKSLLKLPKLDLPDHQNLVPFSDPKFGCLSKKKDMCKHVTVDHIHVHLLFLLQLKAFF